MASNILCNLSKALSHHFLSHIVPSPGHADLDFLASLPEIDQFIYKIFTELLSFPRTMPDSVGQSGK